MAVKVLNGGVWKTLARCKVFSSGAWRDIVAVRIFSAGSWRLVTFPTSGSGMTVSIAPSPFAFSGGANPSGNLGATPSSGIAPFTYLWTVVTASDPSNLSLANTTTAIVGLTQKHVTTSQTATIRCTVTDALGNVAHADASGSFS